MRTAQGLLRVMAASCTLLLAACSGGVSQAPAGAAHSGEAPSHPAPEQAVATPAPQQIVTGLGVNANVHSWNNGQLRPAIDKIAELGDVTWPVIIEKADWGSRTELAESSVIDASRNAGIYERGKMADLWNTIAYINSKPGQQVMVNVMGSVPEWMGGNHIDPASEDQWVRMIASMVAYGRTVRHVDFTLLGPMNETDWNGVEGPQVQPDQYARILHKLLVQLDELGLSDIRLVGPDTASASRATSDYLPALAADSLVMGKMAHFGIHSYDGSSAGVMEALKRATDPGMDFWVTEFAGPCPGCDTGPPPLRDWSVAAGMAEHAIALLSQGAAGLLQYDAWDGYYEHHGSTGYWGLLAYDSSSGLYLPRKSYYVLKQLIRYTPRGAVRIPASSTNGEVDVVAVQDPASGRLTIFGQNTSDSAVPVTLRLPGVGAAVRLDSFVTDSGRNMEADGSAILTDGTMTMTAGPQSVFTLTGVAAQG